MKKFRKLLLLLPALFLLPFLSSKSIAQSGSLRGFVYEKETGEPVLFTNVYFYKTSIGAPTDANGYFAITKIPPGDYTLMVTYIGFDTLTMPVTIKAGELQSKKLYLTKSTVQLDEISVSAARQDKIRETQTSIIKITPKEIQSIPTIGGQPDLAQYLQILPGVVFSGDQGGQLYIRGGPPIQNKVLYDGMIVYNPFHSIGLFSVFDVDILKNVEVYTGGFGAEYGGRISSVMDVTTRDGNKNRIAGKFDISTFGAKALLEGPIYKPKNENEASATFLLSVKNSYLEQSSKIFYKYIDENGLPYNYLDIYGKIAVNTPNGSKINIFGFDFSDKVHYKVLQDYNWNSFGGGFDFIAIPAKSSVLIEGNFAYSKYKVELQETNKSARSSSIAGFNGGFNFTYFLGRDALKYGIELSQYNTVFDFFNAVNRKIDYSQNSTEASIFVKYKWMPGKFIIEPGLRAQYYASLSNLSVEPRLAIKYNVLPNFRLKMAAGMYSQNLISTTYDKDVVNLFYGYITSPMNLPTEFMGKSVTNRLQRSSQVVLGFEWDILKNLSINIEGYYKYYPQLTSLNRNKLYDDTEANINIADYYKKDFVLETGDAEGVDVSIKYDWKKIHLWLTYSLGYIHRNDGVSDYVPPYDRRHNLNLVGTFFFGKKSDWEFDVRYNYGSGFPFTQTQGFYELVNFQNMGTNYTTENGSLGILYGDYDMGRLPYYSRLDLNIKKIFFLGKTTKFEISLSVTNALNQQNIFYFDRVSYTRVDQMPLMPSLGLSFSF
ncbi:MAG: TonB-dependent receptor [Alphaproteobacteria bacterium]|nr:TonB-dependent receptor [Alphaproteobacteria bacterium]